MPQGNTVFTVIICVCAVLLAFLLFGKAMKKLLALLANSIIGVILLLVLNKTPIALAINLPSIATSFILGVPGVAALLIVKFIFQI